MINVSVKKGHDLKISGKPGQSLHELDRPETVAVLPEHIPFVKPRLKVETGQKVKIGTPLFEDKRDTDIVFPSPGAGEVVRIAYGKRRIIREIVIRLDDEETCEEFPKASLADLEVMDRETLVDRLVTGGMWPFIRELPFRDLADRSTQPSSVILALNSKDSFQPSPRVYLSGQEELFEYGMAMLKKLSGAVHVMVAHSGEGLPAWAEKHVTHLVRGAYPADDPGVLLYHIKTSSDENRAYYLNGQDLLLLASFMKEGRMPTRRVIAIGGARAKEKHHVLARIGSPVSHLLHGADGSPSYVAGGLWRGYKVDSDSFVGLFESSLTVVDAGDEEEFFGFLRPGYLRPSFSRTFLSVFNPSQVDMDTGMHGEERACVNCGYCAAVCPVDILPQFTFKSILADEIEEALAHGLLDCVECGLCSYVCPSKIEVANQLKTAKTGYYKERA